MTNKELIEKYPFLWPVDWYGNPVSDEKYDYSYTFLDDMPEGWRKCFGLLLCEDIKNELIRCNFLDDYRVLQVKEKYGGLRWYTGGVPKDSKLDEIVHKYEHLSEQVCITCGKVGVPVIDDGWISPQCKDCYKKMRGRYRNDDKEPNWEKIIVSDKPFNPHFQIERYSKDEGETIINYDISDIYERISDEFK